MARDSRRMALYEVISKSGLKAPKGKELSRLKLVPRLKSSVNSISAKSEEAAESNVRPWPNRPKWLRFYNDRIEFSMSWQVAAIAVLAVFAVFLVFFRLGRMTAGSAAEKVGKSVPAVKAVRPAVAAPVVRAKAEPFARPATPKMVEPMGDNVIAIASYRLVSHLEPVKSYFAAFGIETEIIRRNGRYLLVTTQRYDNPEKVGTDGYKARQKIIEIGAKYKPPKGSGYESFAPRLFSDAYGMKIKKSN